MLMLQLARWTLSTRTTRFVLHVRASVSVAPKKASSTDAVAVRAELWDVSKGAMLVLGQTGPVDLQSHSSPTSEA